MKEESAIPRPSLSSSTIDDEENVPFISPHKPKKSHRISFTLLLIAALVLSNAAWLWYSISVSSSKTTRRKYAAVASSEATSLKPLHWNTPYSSENKTQSNELWKGLFPPGQGIISLPNSEVAVRHLPASIPNRKLDDTSFYFVAAFHQIHCLSVIRAALYHFQEGVEQTVPMKHTMHCIDSLRQKVMCHADSELLYSEDGKVWGDGQVSECQSWDKVWDWTAANGGPSQ
ncbi:hypothetical protein EJ04DRAFT_572062 [Polyplosphaeria fusca]|uniref:Uncharacterized protein n=1 Tax=Polyplosphaeria fusca TaxID=682080 RepID=A0A9P4V5K2_9PLEO|nr:hypothetical protein EJ04DRAFT_572062 [Polyplosphaeria fusca]